jgi:hypothetical protein
MTLSRQSIVGIGVSAGVLTALALAAANFLGTEPGESGGGAEYVVTLGASLLVAVALFGWVIPRAERPGRSGLVVGLIALLSLAAFWSGLPMVLGPGAAVLGLLGRDRGEGATATAAVVLGSFATLAAIAAVIADQTV